ncbi:zinc-binding dehydrogenase [Kitasatospora aureofaciens]|uniref:zinc-dependent alcohol dehydrogenase n=1 Tax=Kitasatospora aureofaciens TaxID=1894 RepID=UPI001C490C3F|nr:alcohol dehydrogenase catalytic domain-containing protein [Kitasatospora aureofaciens]MBV6702049.1 alcohol dehydrogenase catalytic domain-containing protein [Kitasatospora aureofaciens]
MTAGVDLRLTGPGKLDVGEAHLPTAPLGPDEVLVEVDRVTLCGSDHALYDGSYGGPSSYPLRFGHEWSGRVVDTGANGRSLLGRWVTGDCSRWCGDCPRCATDRNVCARIQKFGLTVDGFSTRLRTVDRRYLYPDTHDLGPGLLALSEFFAVAAHGLHRVDPRPDERVLVIGAGALGLASYLLLTGAYGVGRVELLEADPAKAAAVAELLPSAPVHTAEPEPDTAAQAAGGYAALTAQARYALTVDCSSGAGGLATALAAASPRGRVLCFGLRRSAALRTDLLVANALTLVGSIGGTGGFARAQEFLAGHREEAARLVTHHLPAERAAEAFTLDPRTRIKTQLLFGEEPR